MRNKNFKIFKAILGLLVGIGILVGAGYWDYALIAHALSPSPAELMMSTATAHTVTVIAVLLLPAILSCAACCLISLSSYHLSRNLSGNDLVISAEVGDLNDVLALLENGINVNSMDQNGNTALIAASKKGYNEIVHILKQYHANRTHLNHRGESAADVAANEWIKNFLANWEKEEIKLTIAMGAESNLLNKAAHVHPINNPLFSFITNQGSDAKNIIPIVVEFAGATTNDAKFVVEPTYQGNNEVIVDITTKNTKEMRFSPKPITPKHKSLLMNASLFEEKKMDSFSIELKDVSENQAQKKA